MTTQNIKPLINVELDELNQSMMRNLVMGWLRLMGFTELTITDVEGNLTLRKLYNSWLENADNKLIADLMTGGSSVDPMKLKLIRTKKASYEKVQRGSGEKVKEIVFRVIDTTGPISRNSIARATGLRINSCTARVNELIKEGRVHVIGYEYDEFTDRNVELLSSNATPISQIVGA